MDSPREVETRPVCARGVDLGGSIQGARDEGGWEMRVLNTCGEVKLTVFISTHNQVPWPAGARRRGGEEGCETLLVAVSRHCPHLEQGLASDRCSVVVRRMNEWTDRRMSEGLLVLMLLSN